MTTTTQTGKPVKPARKPRPRPERHARISQAVNGCYAVELTVGKEQCRYWLEPFPAEQGSAFKLLKFEEYHVEGEQDVYHVLLGADLAHSSCECKGWLRWSHCKHVEGLLALVAQGKLAVKVPSTADTCNDFDF